MADPNPIKPSCGNLDGIFNKVSCMIGVGAPTMANAQPNLVQSEADNLRQRVADGNQNMGIASGAKEALQRTAGTVQTRQQMLNNI